MRSEQEIRERLVKLGNYIYAPGETTPCIRLLEWVLNDRKPYAWIDVDDKRVSFYKGLDFAGFAEFYTKDGEPLHCEVTKKDGK